MVRYTDRPAMTIAVDLRRKATKQTYKQANKQRVNIVGTKYQLTSVKALV